MNPQRWFQEHSLKLLAIRDTPEAIAGGVAIGIFIGFTPLFGLKTILTILFAWLTGSNIIAAVIASRGCSMIWPNELARNAAAARTRKGITLP